MYLTGFADEAAVDIDEQIRATKTLGWKYIEARGVNGKNIHDLSDAEFDAVYGKLEESGIMINCFGSAIANHGKNIDDPNEKSLEETRRAIPRMKRLGTKLVRIMSYAVLKDREPQDQMKEERFRKLREICRMFLDEGIQPVHENCMCYGGMGWPFSLEILENVPGLKLVFDTGNPVVFNDYAKPRPYPKQSSWEFYSHVRDHVIYVHIKDGYIEEKTGKEIFTYPTEGKGDVEKIVTDLLSREYDGGFSIEPHIAVVYHDDSVKSPEQARFDVYVEYGRRMMALIDRVKRNLSQ
ncbi:sugar phosphate isomerase/epimerase [Candidatus Sumerlaeota bacterium]|nr:sugar phosphate isomerase/epimerase [Candidatus Sumerlaeota bacterium]